jgi:hypothetical protein
MLSEAHVLYVLIVVCEVAFWLTLLLGLVVRYMLRRRSLSRWLLLSLPLIDILLLIFTALDLAAGATVTFAHGLAAVYIGFTIAFGSIAVRWADAHFAHRFAAGSAPPKPPNRGWKAVRYELGLWLRCIAAWIIALGLLSTLIAFLGNETPTESLQIWYRLGIGSVFFWFLFGPLWTLIFSSWRRKG